MHRRLIRTVALLGSAVLGSTLVVLPIGGAAAKPAVPADPGGQLVLVGGGLADDNAAVYEEIVRRAGGADARIGVVTAAAIPASQDPDAGTPDANNAEFNGTYYSDLLESYGAGDVEWIPLDLDRPEAATDPAVVAQVDGMTGFFFGGGDQYRYVQLLTEGEEQRDTPLLAAIRERFEAGAVVAGTSAGAQIQAGADMVTGGESYQGIRDGSAPGYFEDATVLGYLSRGGFGFFRSGLLDTHFSAWGREGRAIRLASDTGNERVFGLDPDTALVVDAAGTDRERLSVIGSSGISVLDLRRAVVAPTDAGWGITGVRWSWLTEGDAYDPRRWRVTPATDTNRLRPVGGPLTAPTDDVLSSPDGDGNEFRMLDLARDLVAHRQREVTGTSYESAPTVEVTLRRGAGTEARTRDGATTSAFSGLVVSVRTTS